MIDEENQEDSKLHIKSTGEHRTPQNPPPNQAANNSNVVDSINTTISINIENYDDEFINSPSNQRVELILNSNKPFGFKAKGSIF